MTAVALDPGPTLTFVHRHETMTLMMKKKTRNTYCRIPLGTTGLSLSAPQPRRCLGNTAMTRDLRWTRAALQPSLSSFSSLSVSLSSLARTAGPSVLGPGAGVGDAPGAVCGGPAHHLLAPLPVAGLLEAPAGGLDG